MACTVWITVAVLMTIGLMFAIMYALDQRDRRREEAELFAQNFGGSD